jgi:hypothetical protein
MCRLNLFVVFYEEIYKWTKEHFESIGVEHDYTMGPCSIQPHHADQPPSTGKGTPVMLSAAAEHMNTASPASCSGVTNSLLGIFSPTSARFASSVDRLRSSASASTDFLESGVNTQPGQIALQVIPMPAVSSAVATVRSFEHNKHEGEGARLHLV